MPVPLVVWAVGSFVAGAYVGDKLTGASTDAANAVGSASRSVFKLALLAGTAYVAYELYQRGGFK